MAQTLSNAQSARTSTGSGHDVGFFDVVVIFVLHFHGWLKDSEGVHREQSSTRRPDAAYLRSLLSGRGSTMYSWHNIQLCYRQRGERLTQSKNAKHLL